MFDGNPIGFLITIGVELVAIRFPAEFKDPSKRIEMFEISEMVCDELANKNFDIIWQYCYRKFANIKDINIGIEN